MYCAYSTPAFNTNGYSVRTRGVAAGLKQSGSDVVVVGRSGYPWDTKTDVKHPSSVRHVVSLDGVDYVHLPGHKLGSLPTDHYVLECADAFVREARLTRPSVIHAASNYQIGLAGLIAARRLGLPFVYEVRGLWEITEASDKPGWESDGPLPPAGPARDPRGDRGGRRARDHGPDPRRAGPPGRGP